MAGYKTPPCPACGVWECLDCGTRANRRNRYYPGQHHCRTCKSLNGRMLPTHHRPDVYENHVEELDRQATCYYPLEEEHSKEGPNIMREIMTGCDVGTRVDFRSQGNYEAQHPWPAETTVSAGSGVVFVHNATPGEARSYGTLFMEVYPPGASFIRGEGDTPESCEDAAWAKYQLALHCSDQSGTHDWEARSHHNGAGVCTRCNTFGSKVFTGEQLGQFCRVCGVGTTYYWEKDATSGSEKFLCEEHYVEHKPTRSAPSDHPLAQLLDALLDEEKNQP